MIKAAARQWLYSVKPAGVQASISWTKARRISDLLVISRTGESTPSCFRFVSTLQTLLADIEAHEQQLADLKSIGRQLMRMQSHDKVNEKVAELAARYERLREACKVSLEDWAGGDCWCQSARGRERERSLEDAHGLPSRFSLAHRFFSHKLPSFDPPSSSSNELIAID